MKLSKLTDWLDSLEEPSASNFQKILFVFIWGCIVAAVWYVMAFFFYVLY